MVSSIQIYKLGPGLCNINSVLEEFIRIRVEINLAFRLVNKHIYIQQILFYLDTILHY